MLSISDVREDLQRSLARLILEHGAPGASVAVAIGDETLAAAAGVVNRRTGVAASPDSVFQIQSITKIWTATLVMQLVDEGLVDLDDPIGNHLPGFRTADPDAGERITIRHLLTHTGGFEGDTWAATTTGDDALQRLVEDVISEAPQIEPPGARYSYCSAGMAVLGRLIEVKRGLPFATALRVHLADPLGIKEIAFNADEALGFNTAIGHLQYDGRGVQPLPVWATMPASNPAAGNQLAMSAPALLSFARMHLADGRGPGGERMLSAASAAATRAGTVAIPASPLVSKEVGLGWEVYHSGAVVGHGGGALGVNAMLLLVPGHRTAVVLLTNGGDFRSLLRDLVDPWIEKAANVTVWPAGPVVGRPEPSAETGRFVGVYGARNTRVVVQAAENGLEVSITSTDEAADMLERAGIPSNPSVTALRQVAGGLFAAVTPDGRADRYTQFLDGHPEGPDRFIHMGGRSLPRLAS